MSLQIFVERIEEELLSHPVIKNNQYCKWFRSADLTMEDVRDFTREFSVFSNQFIIAQLHKVINAVDIEEARSAKEILANEIGVVFRTDNPLAGGVSDLDILSAEGTVEGGTYRFRAAHFEWLVQFAKPLGLKFGDLGKRIHGSPHTLFYCDELIRIYGSEDFNTASGASFAVENWAAAGFWKDLIAGLENFKRDHCPSLHLGFFRWHDTLEDQHAEHTRSEMERLFGQHNLDEDAFITAGNEMLDGVQAFWSGLDLSRKARLGNPDRIVHEASVASASPRDLT